MSRHEIAGRGTNAAALLYVVGESAHVDLVQGRNELRLGGLLCGNFPFGLVLD